MNPRQRLAYLSMEGEGNYPEITRLTREWEAQYAKLADKSMHNLVLNYRLDADVPTIYATFNEHAHVVPVEERERKALYLQSACRPYRDGYVRELMKFFPVDALGACLNNAHGKDGVGRQRYWMNVGVYSRYKFALCFENTATDYYVTERLFHALESGTLPVYFGAPNVDLPIPPHSVIFVADYPDPKDLAAYLSKLDNDIILCIQYWRKPQASSHPGPGCA